MTDSAPDRAPTVPLRPAAAPTGKEPLWRHIVGDALRRERLAQERTLKDVAETARISMPYLSELERGRKEASSEVLAAAAHALGLGLADLLALAQGELARIAQVRQPRLRPALAPQHAYGAPDVVTVETVSVDTVTEDTVTVETTDVEPVAPGDDHRPTASVTDLLARRHGPWAASRRTVMDLAA